MNGRSLRRRAGALLFLGIVLASLAHPATTIAHPLGNFTINHYAGLRIESDAVRIDLVIDQAEIPAFQARLDMDADGDAEVTADEIEVTRIAACRDLVADLHLTADDTALDLTVTDAGLTFPLGAGGLATMRLVCGFHAALPAPLTTGEPTRIGFRDASFAERLGWREIVVEASGATIVPVDGALRTASVSERLTVYPEDRIADPLADAGIVVAATAGGAVLPPWSIVDATPIKAPPAPGASATPDAAAPGASATPDAAAPATPSPVPAAVVPGGVGGGELPSIFREADVTPLVLVLSLLTAAVLGAGHALTPGHGKTLMAAYLVGTRGTPIHALGLGASVSLSHTVGILILAAVIVGAADVLPADAVVRAAPVVAAISIVAIGGWMLVGEARRRRAARGVTAGTHDHADEREHDHAHEDHHEHAGREHADHDHDHGHAHDHAADTGVHTHGGVRHSHLPAAGSTITWRSLFVLGLAGGLIPSTSALLILLGSIAAGRPQFGFVLVLAFGLGMAAVMTGIGLAMVVARGRLDGASLGPTLGRVREAIPLVAAVLVFGFGIYLTAQAIGGTPTL